MLGNSNVSKKSICYFFCIEVFKNVLIDSNAKDIFSVKSKKYFFVCL